jgi:hypothetical protein
MKIPQLKNQIKTNHCKIIWAEKRDTKTASNNTQTASNSKLQWHQYTIEYHHLIIQSVSNKCIFIHGVKPNNTHKSSKWYFHISSSHQWFYTLLKKSRLATDLATDFNQKSVANHISDRYSNRFKEVAKAFVADL